MSARKIKPKQKTPPGERRRQAIMKAAWSLFRKKGYNAVTVDEIIRVSGGSKSSLYEYFQNKEGVLLAVANTVTEKILKEIRLPVEPGRTPRQALRRIGNALGSFVLSATGIGLYRLAVSNAASLPEVARLFYESGPNRALEGLTEYLAQEAESGRLAVPDPRQAAEFFLWMILGQDHLKMSLGEDAPTPSRLRAIVSEAVDVFLAAYGKEQS